MLYHNLGTRWTSTWLPARAGGSSSAEVQLLFQMLIKASVKGCGLSNVAKEWTSFFLLKAKECEFEKSHLNLVTLQSYDFSRE